MENENNEKRHLTSAERQELYKKHAASSISSEMAQRKKRRTTVIVTSVISGLLLAGVIVSLVLCEINIWKPERTYKSAEELYVDEDYLGAYEIFKAMGEYRDAADRAADCIVQNAKKLTGRDDALVKTTSELPWFSIDEEGTLKFDEDKYTGDGNMVIPDILDGIAVTAIGDKCFFYADFMTSVEIPATVTKIGERAFYQCTSLTSVTLPDSVKTLDVKSFAECTSLKEIKFSSSLEEISDRCFFGCISLETLVIPDNIKSIAVRAFNACTSLSELTLPASLSFIGNSAFTGCASLKSVTYGGSKAELEALCVNDDGDVLLKCENIIYGK